MTDPYDAELMAAVFDYSKYTRHILDQAKVLMISPWSLLGSCLGQAAIATPYDVLLPPIIGKAASINPLMVGVGASGSGKGISTAPVLDWPDTDPFNLEDGEQRLADAFMPLTPGSGEGISALFRENRSVPGLDGKGKITVHAVIRRAAWIDFPEVDQLSAIASRVGSSMSAEIRKVWSGEPLGTLTKVKANQLMVPAHSYRAVVIVSAQPQRCGPLLEEEAGGTPQRVLWLSADDPAMEIRDEEPNRLGVVLPDFGVPTSSPRYFDVAQAIRAEIKEDRVAGKWKGTVDSHRNLVRLKAAAACSVLHGSTTVTPETWEWAGALVLHSVRVRESIRAELAAAEDAKSRNRAVSQALTGITADSVRETAVENVAKAMERWMRKNPDKTPTADGLRKSAVANASRSLVPEAVEMLLSRRAITEAGPTRVGTPTYRLAKGGTGERGTVSHKFPIRDS